MKKLTKLKILIAIPSFGRPENVVSHHLFKEPVIFVHTSQIDQYKASIQDCRIEEYPLEEGNIARKKNYIIDWAKKNKYDVVYFIDDDYGSFIRLVNGTTERVDDVEYIYNVIERLAVMAMDMNSPLFAVHNVPDVRRYQRNKPFLLFSSFKRGNFGIALKQSKLRFDERFVLNEDIDIGLQAILNYRVTLIDNRFGFLLKAKMGAKGGLANVRTTNRETEYFQKLVNKWGRDRVTTGKSLAKRLANVSVSVVNPFK